MTLYSGEVPEGRNFKGFIQPQNASSDESLSTPPGFADKRRFVLFAPDWAITDSDTGVTVLCGGERYILLRAEPMFIGNQLTHLEGLLRLA